MALDPKTRTLVRLNGKLFTRNSVAVRVNGVDRITGVDSVDWSDERESKLVPSGADHAKPVARSLGDYSAAASIAVYADEASYFEDCVLRASIDPTAAFTTASIRNLTRAPFALSIAMREDTRSRVVLFEDVVIKARPGRTIGNDGTALVATYDLQPFAIVENGNSLIDLDTKGRFLNEDPALDYVLVQGQRSPGKATISGLTLEYGWDIQEGYGIDAAFMTYKGRKLIRFTATFTLVGQQDFFAWEFFKKLLEPPATVGQGKLPLVPSWSHPRLASANVNAVTLLSRSEPERQSDGTWLVTCSCIEWRPPKPVLVKPRGSIPAVEKGKPVKPKTEADLILDAAQERYDESSLALKRPPGVR